jgi:hypothetical protein
MLSRRFEWPKEVASKILSMDDQIEESTTFAENFVNIWEMVSKYLELDSMNGIFDRYFTSQVREIFHRILKKLCQTANEMAMNFLRVCMQLQRMILLELTSLTIYGSNLIIVLFEIFRIFGKLFHWRKSIIL